MVIISADEGPPDETIFAALGQLVYAFTELEASLLNALVTALGESDQAKVIVAGLNFNQALDRFSVLYAELLDASNLKEFCLVLSAINEERNRHIHSNWGFWGSGQPMRMRSRLRRNKGLAFSMETVEPKEVVSLAKRMDDATERVYDYRLRYMKHRRSVGFETDPGAS